jgi:XTP/dITP diphosphohydrolase
VPVTGGRLVLLVTTPTVRPGLLTWQAWQELHGAARVLAGSPAHPLLPVLSGAGIGWDVLAAAPPARATAGHQAADRDLAARLVAAAAAAGGGGTVVWLCGDGGAAPGEPAGPGAAAPGDQPAEAAALAAAVADLGGPAAEVLTGAEDLPGGQLLRLVTVMDRLRDGCPWDARQTHESLAPHLLEEPYEALEALESGDPAALREELGDVLLQVMFHARIAAERTDGTGYTIDDVADGIVTKLVRRHPHVFGDVTVSGHEEVKRNWDAIKAAEREAAGGLPASALDGVPFGQPALALAAQLQRRAERAGVPPGLADLSAGAAGRGEDGGGAAGRAAADLGAELFTLVTTARAAGLDPELELRAAARRYRDRVRGWEQARRS